MDHTFVELAYRGSSLSLKSNGRIISPGEHSRIGEYEIPVNGSIGSNLMDLVNAEIVKTDFSHVGYFIKERRKVFLYGIHRSVFAADSDLESAIAEAGDLV